MIKEAKEAAVDSIKMFFSQIILLVAAVVGTYYFVSALNYSTEHLANYMGQTLKHISD